MAVLNVKWPLIYVIYFMRLLVGILARPDYRLTDSVTRRNVSN